jgi:hypothetical protein
MTEAAKPMTAINIAKLAYIKTTITGSVVHLKSCAKIPESHGMNSET